MMLLDEIKKMGAFDVNACCSCGVCTAICPLSENGDEFPRKMLRYAMVGLEKELLGSPQLWECYYCGECTKSCPRQADPGGFMMAARKYAITRYSVGKIGKAFYNKTLAPLIYSFLSVFSLIGILLISRDPNGTAIFTIPEIYIHLAGLVLGTFVIVIVIANLAIMYRYISGTRKFTKNIEAWVNSLIRVIIKEVIVQERYSKCSDRLRRYAHLSLVLGFILLMIATTIDYITATRPISGIVLGFAGGIMIIFGSGFFIYQRLKHREPYSIHGDFIDWAFIILIFLAGCTGFSLDFLTGLSAVVMMYIHLTVVFDLIVTAPFTKFAHAIYRTFALWLKEVQIK
jgi:ferredoxin